MDTASITYHIIMDTAFLAVSHLQSYTCLRKQVYPPVSGICDTGVGEVSANSHRHVYQVYTDTVLRYSI